MTPTISVRALDSNHDPMWGQGQSNFLTDLDAVAQIIQTRLLLLQGEWWADLTDGLPVLQSMLGVGGAGKNSDAVSALIKANIEATPYVKQVIDIATIYDPSQRTFSFTADVETQFGSLTVSYIPPGASAILPT